MGRNGVFRPALYARKHPVNFMFRKKTVFRNKKIASER